MKRVLVVFIFLVVSIIVFAQKDEKDVFAFNITDYIQNTNDSISIVQIQMPDGFTIDEKQVGLLKRNFSNNKEDTARIGFGRCNLIKGDYYYFGIRLDKRNTKPQAKDIVYTRVYYGANFKSLIYKLTRNAIYLTSIYDSAFYKFSTALWLDENKEKEIIGALAADIQFTGKAMLEQTPQQNQTIKGGIFNGKKLFDAMQLATYNDVVKFLKYVNARPQKYSGNTWKISETFATWMVSETPTVIE